MKIQDVMMNGVQTIDSEQTVLAAAQLMLAEDIGLLPVKQDGSLVGVITDRDIVLRVVAAGLPADRTLVLEAMTQGTQYCYEDDEADEVARSMAQAMVMRLPVMSHDQRLVGVVSMDDLIPLRPPTVAVHTH